MKKVLRYEEVNPDNVVSLGKATIEFIERDAEGVTKEKGFLSVPDNVKTTKNFPVEIFAERVDGSTYIYAGDKDGNLYEHLNGYVGLWIKPSRD